MIKYGSNIILSLLLSIQTLIAQRFIAFPFGGYDEVAVIEIGFQYNYVNQNFQLTLKENWKQLFEELDTDAENVPYLGELKSIHSKPGHGFSIGIPMDYNWSDQLAVNFSSTFNIINAQQGIYSSMNVDKSTLMCKSKHILQNFRGDNFNSFEFPVALKLRSEKKKIFKSDSNYRAYILGGVRLTRWTGIIDSYEELAIEKEITVLLLKV